MSVKTDEEYMSHALKLAKMAYSLGEAPIGAVVVDTLTGDIIGEGYNLRETEKSPLAHAEIIAIDKASKKLGGWRVVHSTLYVTLEPCPMCAGAIINSRIDRVVYGASDPKAGSLGSLTNLFELGYNHKPQVTAGVMQDECSAILSEFFSELRQKKLADKKSK
ncbi:MAG TPA: nucleoside deaminase [Candidatus Faeciplasma pullistercoris]|uniref:tRNA-specific adenosine deaminase n=1 Tax=Candidatus Faeciplasma pullistercoris TaxID=2840800 RepID=A0A9D1KL06_9FIRM|nr:nucleoside deaminase [Candidatus Faeciplasma pullistercoris]